MKPKLLAILLISLAVIFISGYWLVKLVGQRGGDSGPISGNVTVENNTQVIELLAKGGYSPQLTNAKAGLSTIIRIRTDNSYDCSVSLAIPKLNYQNFLPPSGVVDIPVSAEQATGKLSGICGMGMYSFKINFRL